MDNQHGFGLLEVMVSAGLLGIVSLGVMNVNKMASQGSASLESKFDVMNIVQDIDMRMKMGMCKDTLSGKKFGDRINLPALKKDDGSNIFAVGTRPGGGKARIASLQIMNDTVKTKKDESATGFAYLQILFDRGKGKLGSRMVMKRIPLTLSVDKNSIITNCFSDADGTLAATKTFICEDLGGKMVDGRCTDLGKVCNRDHKGAVHYENEDKKIFSYCNGLEWEEIEEEEAVAQDGKDCQYTDSNNRETIYYAHGSSWAHDIENTCPENGKPTLFYKCDNGKVKEINNECLQEA